MRIVNRLLAFIVAVALLAVGVIVITEVIAQRSGAGPQIIQWPKMLHWGQHNTWKATSVELTCAILAGVGLILTLLQLRRRRPSRFTIEAGEGTDAALTRKGIAVTVRGAVSEVDGIAGSRVKVGRRRISVRAQTSAAVPEVAKQLEPQVNDAATAQLDALRLRPARRLKVAVSSRRNGGQ